MSAVATPSCPPWCPNDHIDPAPDTHTRHIGLVETADREWVTVDVVLSETWPLIAPKVRVIHNAPDSDIRKSTALWSPAKNAADWANILEALGQAEFASLLREAVGLIEDNHEGDQQ